MSFERTLVCEMQYGSHLYGLATPESDLDFMGVYMPSLTEVLTGQVVDCVNLSTGDSKSKNTADDVDRVFYSLPKFVHEVIKGNTTVLDMLHAPESALLSSSPVWEKLQAARARAYTKSMQSFVGYVRTQANKYGEKGRRLATVKMCLKVCEHIRDKEDRLADYWEFLPVTEHTEFETTEHEQLGTQYFYVVCGRKFQNTISFQEFEDRLNKILKSYGKRAEAAESSVGVDWKAVSHALRAGYQARAIFKEGGFTYPLAETEFLKKVKSGSLNFKEEVEGELDRLVDEVEKLSAVSAYPDQVDRQFWLGLLEEIYTDVYGLKACNPEGFVVELDEDETTE